MIKGFKHKGLKNFFVSNSTKDVSAQHLERIGRILDRLDNAKVVQDMNLPGYGLHELTGNRKGTWSVKVSGNWRITFKLVEGEALDVNMEDYH